MKNIKEYMRGYRKKNADRIRRLNREWKARNRDRIRELNVNERNRLRDVVLNHYSGGDMCCRMCGFDDVRALTIDHIDNNGADERRRLFGDRLSAGTTFYRWLRKNNFPTGYQVLCMNCNWIKKVEHQNGGDSITPQLLP